jgi:hypothetical protein
MAVMNCLTLNGLVDGDKGEIRFQYAEHFLFREWAWRQPGNKEGSFAD